MTLLRSLSTYVLIQTTVMYRERKIIIYRNPGQWHSICRAVRYAGLYMGCFEEFSVLFRRDGYLFSTKFLYFFRKMGIYFEENFCICGARLNPFARNFLHFIP